jgi:hypothetical protein
LFVFVLEHRQHRISRGTAGNRKTNIEPLRHRDGKALADDRRNLESVDGDQLALKLSQVDMKSANRRAVDDAQQDASAGLDLHHFGIGERAVVGQDASYFASLRSGLADAIDMPAPFDPSMPAEPTGGMPAMAGILLPFLRVAKISSGGVKLKSASMRTISCSSGRSR